MTDFMNLPINGPTSGGEAYQPLPASREFLVSNHSSTLRMLWIGFYTNILNFFTLTLFRFWGRTRFRRQLWSDTRFDEEPLEYTGRGMELFMGFLLATLTVFLPLVGLLLGAQTLLPPLIAAPIILIAYLGIYALLGSAIFLARRYHLSRTRLHGVRFAMTGSALGYGLKLLWNLFLTGITLGWYGPIMQIQLARGLWENSFYGDEKFTFFVGLKDRGDAVYGSFALSWIGSVAGLIGFVGVLGPQLEKLTPGSVPDPQFIGLYFGSLIVLGVVITLASAWHQAVMIRRITKCLSLGGLQFTSRINMGDILWLAITNFFLIVFTLGFGAMAAQMRHWRLIANRLSADGQFDFARIRQNADAGPKTGEGLADGFDIVSNF